MRKTFKILGKKNVKYKTQEGEREKFLLLKKKKKIKKNEQQKQKDNFIKSEVSAEAHKLNAATSATQCVAGIKKKKTAATNKHHSTVFLKYFNSKR